MKVIAKMFFAISIVSGGALGMTRMDDTGRENARAFSTAPQQQSGRLGAVYAEANKLVIDGVTYTYSPLTTMVTVNGKRSTIYALKSGDVVQFEPISQGSGRPAMLGGISLQKR